MLTKVQYFGTEYSVGQLNDGTFMNIANNREEFGAVTPENEMKVRETGEHAKTKVLNTSLVGCH
jgi:hypothetical protein